MITYNHEKYIAQAIEGVLLQKTNFPFELIIGEDCSSDSTKDICIDYQIKYPDIIKLYLPEKNKGMQRNFFETMELALGKYIALCDGDDFWTDPDKLQKQVDALEKNQQAVLCFHPMTELHQNGDIFPQKSSVFHRPLNDRIALLNINFISTLTVVFRNDSYNRALFRGVQAAMGDYILYLSLLQSPRSQIIYLPEYMGVYRYGRPQSVSNAIPMERFHSDFIRILQYAKKLPYQWSSIEIASIYLASSREWLNLYKSKMNRKAVFAAIRCWLMSIRCIIQSKLHDTRPIEGAISMNGFLFQTKRGLSFLFQKRRS
ncbi:MAG: glycosyltransferase [Chitinophagaceae bacterium]|nr:glycosyltransferase [Chitinophagaceae bacterium]